MSTPPSEVGDVVEAAEQQVERIRHVCHRLCHELDRFKDLLRSYAEEGPAPAHRRTVLPYVASVGRWCIAPGSVSPDGDPVSYATREAAIAAARAELEADGGGELVIAGADGRIRSRDTIGGGDGAPVDDAEPRATRSPEGRVGGA